MQYGPRRDVCLNFISPPPPGTAEVSRVGGGAVAASNEIALLLDSLLFGDDVLIAAQSRFHRYRDPVN